MPSDRDCKPRDCKPGELFALCCCAQGGTEIAGSGRARDDGAGDNNAARAVQFAFKPDVDWATGQLNWQSEQSSPRSPKVTKAHDGPAPVVQGHVVSAEPEKEPEAASPRAEEGKSSATAFAAEVFELIVEKLHVAPPSPVAQLPAETASEARDQGKGATDSEGGGKQIKELPAECSPMGAAEDRELGGRFKPTRWELFLTGHGSRLPPCAAFLTFLLFGWVCFGILVAQILSAGADIVSFEEQPVQSHPVVQAYYAFQSEMAAPQGGGDDEHLEKLQVDDLLSVGLLSISSLVLVGVYTWWTLESAFLTSCAMLKILFSVPVAFTIWSVICCQQLIWTQCLTVFLILGIGADDAFVLYDAWTRAQLNAPDDALQHWTTRFAYAYRRSFNTMAITTATTCCSFLIGSASPLPQVQNFSIFAGIVVFVDWIFCETFFASAIIVYERYFKSESRKRGECLGPGCCWGGVLHLAKKLPGERCFAKAEGPRKRITERFLEGPFYECLHKSRFFCLAGWTLLILFSLGTVATQLGTATRRAPLRGQDLDALQGSEGDELPLGGAPAVSFVYGIDAEQPMLSWNPERNEPRWAAGVGTLAQPKGQVQLLDMMAMADAGGTRCETRGCLVLGSSLAGACPPEPNAWETKGVIMPADVLCGSGRYCFMEEVADYWAWNEGKCQSRTEEALSCEFFHGTSAAKVCREETCGSGCQWSPTNNICFSSRTRADFPGISRLPELLADAAFLEWRQARHEHLRAAGRGYEAESYETRTGWRFKADQSSGLQLQLAYCSFNATLPNQNTVGEANDWYNRWEAFRTQHGEALGGFQTTAAYEFMVTQNEMVKAAVLGICLCTLVTFVVLIFSTGNWIVSGLGLLCILGVSLVVLGSMPLLGWLLGESECILIIAVVGLSADYTVHLLHSYRSPRFDSREDRSRHALAEMGGCVVNSAVTTMLAAAPLFACSFYFFFQFGVFIFFVVGFSVSMAMTFLIPLLLVLGPQDERGKLHFLWRLPMWQGSD